MTEGQRMISPSFLRKEKDKTFVGLSLPLYFLFIPLIFFAETSAKDKEYFFPKISFFILSIFLSRRMIYFATILPSFFRCSISTLRAILFRALFFILSLDSLRTL